MAGIPSTQPNEGELSNTIRQLAFKQIPPIAARRAYRKLGYHSPSLRVKDLVGPEYEKIADALLARAVGARDSLVIADEMQWKTNFMNAVAEEQRLIEMRWEASWKESCDGKKLFDALHKVASTRMPVATFKRRVVQEMKNSKSENWQLVERLLRDLIEVT